MTASYNSDVDVTVRFAFSQDVYDTTPTWSDVTSVCRGFSISRGRSRVLDQVQPGVATLRLSNDTADFSPWNTSGSYTLKVLDKVNIRAVHNAVTYDLFTGYVTSWPNTWSQGGKDGVVEVTAVDGFHLLAMVEAELTESEEFSGTRIGNLLDTAGWPASWRNLDTGSHNIAALSSEFNSILGEIQRAELVEQGMFFIAGDGDATFKDGNTRIEDDTIQATFSDDGADSGYVNLQVDYDMTQLWNDATVTRVDGTDQNYSDATSISSYGTRDLHVSETLHVADGEALALAQWFVSENKDVRARVPSVTLRPEEDPAQLWPEALGLELLEKANVERTDVTGDSFDLDHYIEGVTHNVTMVGSRSWETTFQLSPDLQHSDWWILGTSQLGVDSRLGY